MDESVIQKCLNEDWDFMFLIRLEYEKICMMLEYFEERNLKPDAIRQMKLCKRLLEIVIGRESDVNPAEDKYVNNRNATRFFPYILNSSTFKSWFLEDLYFEKAWHLYCKAREYYTRQWWD